MTVSHPLFDTALPFTAGTGSAASANELQQLLQLQQQAFYTQPYPTLLQRLDRLDRLQRMLEQHQQQFADAIAADYGHRSQHETRLAEQVVLDLELHYTRRKLRRWMRPRRVATAISFRPAHNRLLRQPLGVVGVVAPWNYPLQLSIGPAMGALAAGNRVMIKPSEFSPNFGAELQQAAARYFGANELAVVLGDAEIGKAFVQMPFDHLLFTGSTAAGRQVAQAAARNLTPVTLELGGKSPALIDLSANMTLSAQRIAAGKLLNAGQTCIAPDYVLVHRSQHDAFVEAYSQAVRTLYPSISNNPDYTSIIHQNHFGRLVGMLEQAHQGGAQIIALGDTDPAQRKLAPCLVLQPRPDMQLMQDEIFGPILPVVIYDNTEQALEVIRQGTHPLALYWFGEDAQARDKMLHSTLAGGVTINDCLQHFAQLGQPFGGVGASGMGHYRGEWGFRTFSHEKPIFHQARLSGTQWLRPPYGERFEQVLRLLRVLR